MLNEEQRRRIEVVLVSPRNPLNIGAASRALANFGLHRLCIAAPYLPHWEEAKHSAVGADAVLENARVTSTLAEAVAGATLVLGTGSLTYRKPEQPVLALPQMPPVVEDSLARGQTIALVFGPEKRGLTREDLSYCHRLVVIPTDAHQPSMNLGQAVAVCLYELARGANAVGTEPAEPQEKLRSGRSSTAPDAASLDRMAELIETTMSRAGYSPHAMQQANRHDLRLMVRRMQLESKDVRRILGLFRRILARMK